MCMPEICKLIKSFSANITNLKDAIAATMATALWRSKALMKLVSSPKSYYTPLLKSLDSLY